MKKFKGYLLILPIFIFIIGLSIITNIGGKEFKIAREKVFAAPACTDNGNNRSCTVQFDSNGTAESNADAIQSALDKARNLEGILTVKIPEGTWEIDDTLYIYSNTILSLGNGEKNNNTTIKNINGGSMKTLQAVSDDFHCVSSANPCDNQADGGYNQWHDIVIKGGTWDLNYSLESTYPNMVGFKFNHGKNLVIKNTTIKNGAASAVNISASNDVTITKVTFENQITKSSPQFAEMIYIGTASSSEGYDIKPADGTPTDEVIINECTFTNIDVALGMHNYSSPASTNLNVTDNTFENIRYTAMNLYSYDPVTITGNTASGTNGSYAFIMAHDAAGTVANNNVSGFEYTLVKSNPTTQKVLQLSGVDNSQITDKFYFVNFNCGADDCSGDMPQNVKFIYGTKTAIPKNTLTRPLYEFSGWYAHRTSSDEWWTVDTTNSADEGHWRNGLSDTIIKKKFVGDEGKISTSSPIHHDIVDFYARWRKIVSIKVITPPDKTAYIQNYENKLDLTGGKLEITLEDGDTFTRNLTNSKVIKPQTIDSSKVGPLEIDIEFNGVHTTLTGLEVVSKQVKKVSLLEAPTKTQYGIGENLDLTGGKLTITFDDGSTSIEPMTSEYVKTTGFDSSKKGRKTIIVEYQGHKAKFAVTIGEATDTVVDVPNTGKSYIIGIIAGMIIIVAGLFVLNFSISKSQKDK